MAWETRGARPYYYKSRRIGNTVRKLYVGSGDVAKQAAAHDATVKAKRAADQTDLVKFQARLAGVDQLAADVDRSVCLLTEAVLLSAGFHLHKGEWRQLRD